MSTNLPGVVTGGFGGVPASGEAVAGLKRQKHGDDNDHTVSGSGQAKRRRRQRGTGTAHESTTDEEAAVAAACAICLEDLEDGEGLSVMPCAHPFHEGCLTEWLALSRMCPGCRHALPSEGKADGEAPPSATSTALTSAAKGGGAGAGASGGMQGRIRTRQAATRFMRRSRRARQANVRLFGPERTTETSDDGLGLQQ